jgi:hypothetical protein
MVRLPWLALSAALWAAGARGEQIPRPLCWLDGLSAPEEAGFGSPGSSPGPCIPLPVALDDARRKAQEAGARDRDDIAAMMNVVGQALATRLPREDQGPRGKATIRAGSADEAADKLANLVSATAQPADELMAEVPHPPKRPVAELTRLENARKAALAAALKRKQLAEARKRALASRERPNLPPPAVQNPGIRAWPQPPPPTSGSLP